MPYELGQYSERILQILFPIVILFAMNTKNKKKLPLILLFIFGWVLYVLPMELRPYFRENQMILFWFGIIPSFGCAFSLPVLGLVKKNITYAIGKKRLLISSFITFGLILIYELAQKIKGFGTFDWLDLLMSAMGIIVINLLFINLKSVFEPAFISDKK